VLNVLLIYKTWVLNADVVIAIYSVGYGYVVGVLYSIYRFSKIEVCFVPLLLVSRLRRLTRRFICIE